MNSTRLGSLTFWGVIAAVGCLFVGALFLAWLSRDDFDERESVVEESGGEKKLFPVIIRPHEFHPEIDSGEVDEHGKPIMIGCATCHDNRDSNGAINSAADLDEFHQGLDYHHGNLSCVSCHNPDDYNSLRKADGAVLNFSQSAQLCAQCHGTQYRDYQNGSHGGMTGYWDLTKGPRERNTCIHCHDAHKPAFPQVMPVFRPKMIRGEKEPSGKRVK